MKKLSIMKTIVSVEQCTMSLYIHELPETPTSTCAWNIVFHSYTYSRSAIYSITQLGLVNVCGDIGLICVDMKIYKLIENIS